MIDIHNHTKFSFDSVAEPSEMIGIARKKGASVYGFAEHLNLSSATDVDETWASLKSYIEEIDCLRNKNSDMEVLHGIELNYVTDYEDLAEEFVGKIPFDYVINSVHNLNNFNGFDLYGKQVQFMDKEKLFELYFDEIKNSLNVKYDYHVVGHVGFLIKLIKVVDFDRIITEFKDKIDYILSQIIERKACLEINTNTGKDGCFFPCKRILTRYLELGGERVSLGADAHTPNRVMENIFNAIVMLDGLGFSEITYYKQKKEIVKPIKEIMRINNAATI